MFLHCVLMVTYVMAYFNCCKRNPTVATTDTKNYEHEVNGGT